MAPQNLGVLPGGLVSYARDINSAGDVVGFSKPESGPRHAFLWTASGGMIDLGTLPGGIWSEAWGINDAGEVTGVAQYSGTITRAFLWTPSTGMVELGSIGGQFPNSNGARISSAGKVVGWTNVANGQGHAAIWQ